MGPNNRSFDGGKLYDNNILHRLEILIPERKKLAHFFIFLVLTRSHFFLVFVSECALEDFS